MKNSFQIQYLFAVSLSVILVFSTQRSYGQASLFPHISGWNCTEDSVVYTPNNLWDIIDGAADLFLEYNFVSLHIARYVKSDTLEIKVELYEHRAAEDAFGMYSQERDTGYHFVSIGVQGYLEEGVLNFCAGQYYVKISTIQSGQAVQRALVEVGSEVEKHLKQPVSFPEAFRLLPLEGKLRNTELYIAKNFLGYGFFGNAFVASYGLGEAAFRIFVMKFESPKRATEAFDEYIRTLPKDSIRTYSHTHYVVHDPHHGPIEFILKQNYLAGIVSCNDDQLRELYSERLRTALSR